MPRRPNTVDVRPDPRLAPYRNRAGRLHRDGEAVGEVFVQIEPYCERTGGLLWWSRWDAAREVPHLFITVGRGFADTVVREDAIDEEVTAWSAGRFDFDGKKLTVEWLSDAESDAISRRFFEQSPPTDDERARGGWGALRAALHNLALTAADQVALIPSLGSHDELALDFDAFYSAFWQARERGWVTPAVDADLQRIDELFDLSGGDTPFWTDDALADSDVWAEVRTLARQCLAEMPAEPWSVG